MSLELQVLRTAKAALDEGLLDQNDYGNVKAAFMKALSIKGGVDSGFLTNEDMAEARREFFQSAGMPGLGGGGNNNDSIPRGPPEQYQQAQAQQTVTPPRPQPAQSNGHARQERSSDGGAAPSALPQGRGQPMQLSIPEKLSPGGGGRTPSSRGGSPSRKSQSNVGTPSGISTRGGGAQAVADKVRDRLARRNKHVSADVCARPALCVHRISCTRCVSRACFRHSLHCFSTTCPGCQRCQRFQQSTVCHRSQPILERDLFASMCRSPCLGFQYIPTPSM